MRVVYFTNGPALFSIFHEWPCLSIIINHLKIIIMVPYVKLGNWGMYTLHIQVFHTNLLTLLLSLTC